MAIALKLDAATGRPARLAVADALEAVALEPRTTSSDLIVGATLSGSAELVLAASGFITRVLGDLIVAENLIVEGTTTSVESEVVLLADNHLYLNAGYETVAAQTGGLVVNYLPIATTDTVDTGGFTSATQVTTVGNAFAVGQFIQITGAADPANNGIFEVVSHAGNVLEIDPTPQDDFSQTGFVVDTTVAGTITRVNLSVIRAGTDGVWETALGSTTPLSFSDLGSGTGNDLQAAYDLDPAILIDANGPVALSNATTADDLLNLTRTFVGAGRGAFISMGPGNEAVTGRGLSIVSGTGATGEMLFINNLGTGDALTVQDGGNNVLRVLADGSVAITGQAASLIQSLAGNLTLDSAAAELVLDDVGNSGLTLSQSGDRTLDATGAGEVLNLATSAIGAINRLARAMDQAGQAGIKDYVIENGVTITAGNVVAQGTVSGRVTQMDANGDAAASFVGVALETGTGDAGGTVLVRVALPGNFISDSGASFTAGEALFAPDGTGRPVAVGSQPTNDGDILMRIGWAHSSTEYVVDPGAAFIL